MPVPGCGSKEEHPPPIGVVQCLVAPAPAPGPSPTSGPQIGNSRRLHCTHPPKLTPPAPQTVTNWERRAPLGSTPQK